MISLQGHKGHTQQVKYQKTTSLAHRTQVVDISEDDYIVLVFIFLKITQGYIFEMTAYPVEHGER